MSLMLKIQNKYVIIQMKNHINEKKIQISDPIDTYFECISSCDVKDGNCISMCVEILKQYEK